MKSIPTKSLILKLRIPYKILFDKKKLEKKSLTDFKLSFQQESEV